MGYEQLGRLMTKHFTLSNFFLALIVHLQCLYSKSAPLLKLGYIPVLLLGL